MTQSGSSAMAHEICESADVVSRIVRDRHAIAEVARCLDIGAAPVAVLCGRGSSGHAGVLALPHRNQASLAGVRQCSVGDHGIS